jgi:hypothetical protein
VETLVVLDQVYLSKVEEVVVVPLQQEQVWHLVHKTQAQEVREALLPLYLVLRLNLFT